MTGAGLPHSEIFGSKRACRSPKLIAACCVLHRQITPRHPSMAVTGFMQTLNILGVYFTLLPIKLSKNEIVFVAVSHHPHLDQPSDMPDIPRVYGGPRWT